MASSGMLAVLTLVSGCGGPTQNLSSRELRTTRVRVGDLVLAVPAHFNRRYARLHDRVVRVVVSDRRISARLSLAPSTLPTSGVVLVVSFLAKSAAPPGVQALHLPLKLENVPHPQRGPRGINWNGLLRFHRSIYGIYIWFGRNAGPRDKDRIEGSVTTIKGASSAG